VACGRPRSTPASASANCKPSTGGASISRPTSFTSSEAGTAGFIEPKSRSGKRRVPITNTLRSHLLAHRLQQGAGGHGFVFPNTRGDRPFNPSTVNERAQAAWAETQLEPISLHECRHTYAAYMIAAGINTKALSTYMGHITITITLDRYGHLLPGNEPEAATLLDTWLEASSGT
jgi:integrase